MRSSGHLLCFLACFCMIGGHWAVLQGVAWAGMLRDYSARYGFKEAAVLTFSGEKPCALCRSISEGRENEQKQQDAPAQGTAKVDKSIDALVTAANPSLTPMRQADLDWPPFLSRSATLSNRPLSPPPRAA